VLGRQEEQALAQNRPPFDATVAVMIRQWARDALPAVGCTAIP